MTLDPATALAIAGMALATYLTRLAGWLLVRRVPLQGRARAALEAVPPAVLAAVIAPTVLATGPAETLAGVITVIAALRLPLLAAVLAGVASVVLLRGVMG